MSSVIRAVALAGLIAAAPTASADALGEACDAIAAQLRKTPADRFEVQPAEGAGPGCRIVLDSGWSRIKSNRQHPDSLLSVEEGSTLYRAGWLRDASQDVDGVDGTSYLLLRGDVRCRVTGSWDGGDGGDGRHVPSDRFTYVVNCALR